MDGSNYIHVNWNIYYCCPSKPNLTKSLPSFIYEFKKSFLGVRVRMHQNLLSTSMKCLWLWCWRESDWTVHHLNGEITFTSCLATCTIPHKSVTTEAMCNWLLPKETDLVCRPHPHHDYGRTRLLPSHCECTGPVFLPYQNIEHFLTTQDLKDILESAVALTKELTMWNSPVPTPPRAELRTEHRAPWEKLNMLHTTFASR